MGSVREFTRYAYKRKRSSKDYFAFQRYQGRLILNELQKHISFAKTLQVLDVGSGIGGYVYEIVQRTGAAVVSLDKNPLKVAIERYGEISYDKKKMRLPLKRRANVVFNSEKIAVVEGDITDAPFKDESFDVIIGSSVIEHVPDQKKMLAECYRILKDDGLFYLSFPPYYSPVGGHSISPLHYIPGKFPLWLYRKMHPTGHESFKFYGLVKTTIGSVLRLVKRNFVVVDIKPRIFSFLQPLVRVPVLREALIHHIELFLRKRSKS